MIQKGTDKFVLVPELNYKNYKTLEIFAPELMKLTEPREPEGLMHSKTFWFLVGVIAGGVAVEFSR